MINRVLIARLSFLSLAIAAFLLSAPPTFAAETSIVFSKNHQLWDAGADILSLQQLLNEQGFIVSQSGAGSPGYETATFGPHTYRALVQFQLSRGLPSTGFFGPLTRAALNSSGATSDAYSSSVSQPTATTAASTTPPSSPPLPSWHTKPLPGFAPGQLIFIGGSSKPLTTCGSFACNATVSVAPVPVFANTGSPLGINLSTVSYYSSEQPFLNIFKATDIWGGTDTTSKRWGDNGSNDPSQSVFDLDANGYPKSMNGKGAAAGVTFTEIDALFNNLPPPSYLGGQYIVLYDGQGTLTYVGDGVKNVASSTLGRDVLTVDPSIGAGIRIQITSTDPNHNGNYIRNIRLVYAPYESLLASGEIFNPNFTKLIKPFSTLRFMDWGLTNNATSYNGTSNPTVVNSGNWSNRTNPSNVFWAQNTGVPVETMVALLNETGANGWFNMPVTASDDYLTKYATLVHNSLNSPQKAYIEFSNEVWNFGFTAIQYAEQQGEALWPNALTTIDPETGSNYSAYTIGLDWYAMRSAQMCDIWKSVWGPDANRVNCTIGTQAANPSVTPFILNCTLWSGAPCATNHGISDLAIAPYFGYAVPDSWASDADGGLNRLFTEINQGGLAPGGYAGGMIKQAVSWATAQKAVANSYGLNLVAYESGQSLVDPNNSTTSPLYVAANRDPRMGSSTLSYLQQLSATGIQEVNYYDDIGNFSKFGSWGALESVMATTSPSPKYTALTTFINSTPCWWKGCTPLGIPDTFQPLVVLTAPISGTLIGTSTASLTAFAADNIAIASVQFKVDSTNIGSAITVAPYTATWDNTGVADGTHTLFAVAKDTSGNYATSSVVVTLNKTPPAIAITAPAASSTVLGSSVVLTATASDNIAIASVQFKVDGSNIGAASSTSPYSITWNSASTTDGVHTITAVARNTAGNYATSSIAITVDNNAPVFSAISAGTPTTTSATVTWTTDKPATSQIVYGTTSSYTASTTLDASLVTNHSVTINGLATSTTYHFQVQSTDTGGHLATSSDQSFATVNPSFDLATNAWINAVISSSGTVSTTEEGYVDTLMKSLKTNGLFSNLDRLWLFGSENATQASIDIIHLATSTSHGTLTFSVNHGYTGDGSTGYIDTNVNPSALAGNYATSSASVGVYVISSTTLTSIRPEVSIGASNNTELFLGNDGVGDRNGRLNQSGGGPYAATTNSQGSWNYTRTSSNLDTIYRNGSSFASDTTSSNGVPNIDLFVFAKNTSGSSTSYSPEQIAAAWIGGGMTSAQNTTFQAALNAYMTSLGVNSY